MTHDISQMPGRVDVRAKSEKSRGAPRDATWARWKIASELRWIRKHRRLKGGILTQDGGFNPQTWPALTRTKVIGGAIGREKDISKRAIDGDVAMYLVVDDAMNTTTMKSEIGASLIAIRARVSVRTVGAAGDRMDRLGLWIRTRRHSSAGRWTSNSYDFHESKNRQVLGTELTTTLAAVARIIRPQAFTQKTAEAKEKTVTSRSPARMVVLIWVLNQIILTQASASFTAAELVVGTGLKRRAAIRALNGLLGDGTFVKIGEGTLTVREGLSRRHGRHKVEGPFWSNGALETSDGDLFETSDGLPETADGVPETSDGIVLDTADGVLETSDILLAGSPAVDSEPPAVGSRSVTHAATAEPLTPTPLSGETPSAASGEPTASERYLHLSARRTARLKAKEALALDGFRLVADALSGRMPERWRTNAGTALPFLSRYFALCDERGLAYATVANAVQRISGNFDLWSDLREPLDEELPGANEARARECELNRVEFEELQCLRLEAEAEYSGNLEARQ